MPFARMTVIHRFLFDFSNPCVLYDVYALLDIYYILVFIDFSLTVKAATLIFVSRRGSAISSAKEGKSQVLFIIW